MNNTVHYKNEENYVIITLQNGKANAISYEVIDGLHLALDKAEKEKKIVILTGKEGLFSAGYDLKIMTKSSKDAVKLATAGSKLSVRMLSFPTPIIIACSGHAVAKGAFMLLYADYRIGVAGDFKIGLNEVLIGMTMHNAGIAVAKARLAPVFFERSVNNAEIYSSKDAVTAGFLDKIVPQEKLMETAIKIAAQFSKLDYKAHAATKLRVRKPYLDNIEKGIELDKNVEITFKTS